MCARSPANLRNSGGRILIYLAVLCLTGFWSVVPGRAVATEDWSRYDNWRLSSFRVEGAPPHLDSSLRRGLALTGQWKLFRGQKLPRFSEKLLLADLRRIRLFLAARGYPAALLETAINARPADRQLDLVITIKPGDPVRVGEIEFKGWPERIAAPDTARLEVPALGSVFTDAAVLRGAAAVRSHLLNAGYALVQLSPDLQPMAQNRVRIQFTIETGDFFVIDEVVVDGCSEDLVALARRSVNIPPGTDYAESRLAAASRDLRLTQLFGRVDLAVEAISPGHLRLKTELQNARMRIWDAGVGTWADNPWLVRSSWTHRNLFRGGRGFTARGSFATHEYKAGLGVFWLGWLSPRSRTRTGIDVIAEREDAYESQEYRVDLVQSFRPRERDILNVGLALSENQITQLDAYDTDTPEPQGRLWELWVDRKWDRTNDPLFPVRGGFLKVGLTFAEPWVFSEVPYALVQVDAAKYFDLPWDLVFTSRIRTGFAKSLKDELDVLANRRFYAGGYNSHRGYRRRGLGPRNDDNQSLGGEAITLLSAEVRLPSIWIIEGAFFVDGGNVWSAPKDLRLADFPVAIGATVGLRSPLGPLRVGYAVNVADLVPDQPRRLWHFGMGYPW